MRSTMTALAALVTATALLAGCSGDATDPEAQTAAASPDSAEPSPTESQSPADVVPEEMQGTWLLDIPRDQIGENLEEAGLANHIQRFYKSEGLKTDRTLLAMELEPDFFYIAWRLDDQTWDEGWSGPVRVEGEVIHLDDDYYTQVTDSYRPSVAGDQLTLDYVGSSVPQLRGLPIETYSVAYFSQPWARVDCTFEDLDACL